MSSPPVTGPIAWGERKNSISGIVVVAVRRLRCAAPHYHGRLWLDEDRTQLAAGIPLRVSRGPGICSRTCTCRLHRFHPAAVLVVIVVQGGGLARIARQLRRWRPRLART